MEQYHGSFIIIGPPGTGKTTWISRQIKEIVAKNYDRNSVLVCSLTRAAAAEAAGRDLPLATEMVGTLHAHAFRSLGRPPLADSKIDQWNEEWTQHRQPNVPAPGSFSLRMDGGNARPDVDDPEWLDRGKQESTTKGDEFYGAYGLLRARMVDRNLWPAHVRFFASVWEAWKHANGYIDFHDMISDAAENVSTAPGDPKIIIMDEAQDASRAERHLVAQWAKKAEAEMFVGDAWQALYRWRGASPEILDDPAVPADHQRVLKQSYRVPRAVHAAATAWIRRLTTYRPIEYLPRPEDGLVAKCQASLRYPAPAVEMAQSFLAAGKSVMFQASCSYMLAPLLQELRARGVPYANPWRAKRGDWNPLRHGGKQTTMVDRLAAYLSLDQPTMGQDTRLWTLNDVWAVTSAMASAGTLKRGAKTAIDNAFDLAEVKGDYGLGGLPGADPAGQLAHWKAELAEWFEPQALDDILTMFGGRWKAEDGTTVAAQPVTLATLVDWWMTRLAGTKRKAAEFPAQVVARNGLKAALTTPKCYVGTGHCSPPDEPVLTIRGNKPIGKLNQETDRLMSYNAKCNSLTQGRNAKKRAGQRAGAGYKFKVGSRLYCGDLVVIETERSRTRVTPEHRVRVRFADNFYGKWIVYLMRRGEWWRIGISKSGVLPYKAGGLPGRLSSEQGDDGWILGIYLTRLDALIAETTFQVKYGVPSLCFESYQTRAMSTPDLQNIHEALKDIVRPRVEQLLADLGMFIDAPLYERRPGIFSKKKQAYNFETIAANIISEYMCMPTAQTDDFGGKAKPQFLPCRVRREHYSGLVYSLAVDPYEYYVSGGAVVHNSFKGSEADVVFVWPDISPAGWLEWDNKGESRDSVVRLFYVMMTRAKEALYICRPDSQRHVPLDRLTEPT